MAIPNVITRQNVIEVINQIDNGRVIPSIRLARKMALRFNQTNYPVKILISWGHEVATGQELPYSSFITQNAVRYLTDLGFEIVRLN
jgi:DNA-binding XRE family transcriptional regulator